MEEGRKGRAPVLTFDCRDYMDMIKDNWFVPPSSNEKTNPQC